MTNIKLTCRKGFSSQHQLSDSNLPLLHNNNFVSNGSALAYQPLSSTHRASTSNDEYIDSQFQKPPSRIPTRSICLAVFLCFAGSSLLLFGVLILAGHLDAKFADRVWPMMIMGLLMFIPGAYHVRIAYYAFKGKPGYSFDDIPEFE